MTDSRQALEPPGKSFHLYSRRLDSSCGLALMNKNRFLLPPEIRVCAETLSGINSLSTDEVTLPCTGNLKSLGHLLRSVLTKPIVTLGSSKR
jgi:hypothetical protein